MNQQRHRQLVIGVMGAAQCDEKTYREAVEVGQLIARSGAVLLCGGGTGVMEAAAQGAKSEGGLTIGIMPGSNERESPPNPFIDVAIFTGMSDARNAINASSSDVIIAVGGGFGTLSEIALALKIGKPVVLLHSWRFEIEPPVSMANVHRAETPAEAVTLALQLAKS
ncbi:MAG: TIGR00725 family protein [Acidobacteriota bacterium]|nr:TIGR00725 family protein [Blastocatellia bacterium]MDW8239569.1 TIGR00725 family protein [Acidobacteriota bacterium]